MPLEKIAIAAAVLVVALLFVGVLVLARRASRRNQRQRSSRSRAPRDLHFVCAGCSERFPHTKRTVGAFERGTTRLFCNACHSKWVAGRPRQQQSVGSGERLSGGSSGSAHAAQSRLGASVDHLRPLPQARAPSGCLGTALVLVALPLVLVVYAAVT